MQSILKHNLLRFHIAIAGTYRVSHGIGPTLFFAILSVSTLPKYKNLVSVKKFRKFAIR